MRAGLSALCVAIGLLVAWSPQSAAVADGCYTYYTAHTTDGVTVMEAHEFCPGTTIQVTSDGGGDPPPTDLDRDPICVATAMSLGQDSADFCDAPEGETDVEVTPGMVAAAMARVRFPESVLRVQPPNGRTLVNFKTNFYSEAAPFDTSFALLGKRVDLHLTPVSYTWKFGDGQELETSEPGSPYPGLTVTHEYLEKGQVAASVDTSWQATFQVQGGPSTSVPGTAIVNGDPVDLQVLTATPTLVGYE